MAGEFYIEEASLGNAEDCDGDCVVTRNFSQLEPGVFERKYYAPVIGVFLAVEPDSGEVVRLVKCNVDPRCAALQP